MSKKDMIEKALIQNNVLQDDMIVIKTDTSTTFYIHLLRMLVLLLLNFAMQTGMTYSEVSNFIMQNFDAILDIVTEQLEIALHNFIILYDKEPADIVELHNKDECLLVLAIQNKLNKKLEKLKEK